LPPKPHAPKAKDRKISVKEIGKHLHFGGLHADDGLDLDVNFLGLGHDRGRHHGETDAGRGKGRGQFGEF